MSNSHKQFYGNYSKTEVATLYEELTHYDWNETVVNAPREGMILVNGKGFKIDCLATADALIKAHDAGWQDALEQADDN